MSTVVHITRLSKTYQKCPALKEVDLEIREGEMVALIGPSGSGKSTLLRHLSGLVTCDRKSDSEVHVLSHCIQKAGRLQKGVRRQRAHIGSIFQQFNLVNRMTVMGNVLLGFLGQIPRWRGSIGYFNRQEREAAMQALVRVGMADHAWKRANQLSGGQQQRVAIARALVQKARLILADEPIASLDPESARIVMDSLAQINQEDGTTVIVTLHQVNYARQYCKRTVALKQGHVCFDGSSSELHDGLLQKIYGSDLNADYATRRPLSLPNQPPRLATQAPGLTLAKAQ